MQKYNAKDKLDFKIALIITAVLFSAGLITAIPFYSFSILSILRVYNHSIADNLCKINVSSTNLFVELFMLSVIQFSSVFNKPK